MILKLTREVNRKYDLKLLYFILSTDVRYFSFILFFLFIPFVSFKIINSRFYNILIYSNVNKYVLVLLYT